MPDQHASFDWEDPLRSEAPSLRSDPPESLPNIAYALEIIPDGVVVLDARYCCLFVNDQAERLLARSHKSLFGVSLWEILPGGAAFRAALAHARADGVPAGCEEFLVSRGLWLEQRVVPTSDGLTLLLFRDVTARRQAEAERDERLRLARERIAELEAVIEHMPAGVYVGDHAGINDCNGRAAQMLGLRSAEGLRRQGDHWADLIPLRDAATGEPMAAEREPFHRALRGETCTEEVMVRHLQTGEDCVVRSAAAPIWKGHRVVAAVTINTDITEERRHALRALRRHAAPKMRPALGGMGDTDLILPPKEGLAVRSRHQKGHLVIELEGGVTMDTAASLGAALRAGSEAGALRITVDLRRVDTLDASGLTLLVEASKRLRSVEVPLAPRILVRPDRQPERVLRMGAFSRIMEIVLLADGDTPA